MNIFFLLILFNLTQLSLTLNCFGNILSSTLRGHYRDVVSELNGGLIENAKYITFFGVGNLKSPLKNRIYFSQNDLEDVNFGHARCDRYQSMIFPLTQAYEINTLRIRFWDMDDRIHYVQVFTIQKDLSDEVKIYEGQAQGLVSIHFSDQLVQIIRIYSLGNSYDGYMSIIKIQAFYLRNKNVI